MTVDILRRDAAHAKTLLMATRTLTPQQAEFLWRVINELEAVALGGQQLGAMGQAMTTSAIGPTERAYAEPPDGAPNWVRRQHWMVNGKRMPKESKADLDARKRAESIGMKAGRFEGDEP